MFDSGTFIFSQTSLSSYRYCPRQFKLKYIDQLQWPAEKNSPQLSLEKLAAEGALFHKMAEQYFIGISPILIERQINPSNYPSLLKYWKNFQEFASNTFVLNDQNQSNMPEYSVSFMLGQHNIEAKLDLIHSIRTENFITIYDWKTTKIRSHTADYIRESLQTKLYLLALSHYASKIKSTLNNPYTITYWFADSPMEVISISAEDDDINSWSMEIQQLINLITSDQAYKAVSDPSKCGNCPFRTYCGTGIFPQPFDSENFDSNDFIDDLSYEGDSFNKNRYDSIF